MLVVDLLFKGQQHLAGGILQVKLNLLLLRNALLGLELGDIQHTADQSGQALGLVGDDLQIVGPLFRRNGLVQHSVHIAGNGGHGGFQLMGHIGHELLAAVLALLQAGRHIVKGQGQLLHLFGVALLDLDPGLQIAVAKGIGNLGHLLQGLALPPGEDRHRRYGSQHHKGRNGQKDIGDLGQHRIDPSQGRGDNENAQILSILVGNRAGHQKAFVLVEPLDDPGCPVSALLDDLIQVIPVYIKSLMTAIRSSIGADDNLPLGIADHRIGPGYLGGHIQIHEKFPAAHAVFVQAGRKILNDRRVLLQSCEGGLRQIVLHHHLKGPAQHRQGHQQNPRKHGKAPAEGGFHRHFPLFPAGEKMSGYSTPLTLRLLFFLVKL